MQNRLAMKTKLQIKTLTKKKEWNQTTYCMSII